MNQQQPKTIYLKDYQPYPFVINSIFMHVDLHEDATIVSSVLSIARKDPKNQHEPLILNGQELILKKILLDGEPLSAENYQLTEETLTINNLPAEFSLETVVEIKPQNNTKLSGLYKSSGNYCTQCESQGFRRITYFPDRPDVLTRFTTTISADKTEYPILLSNGNLIEEKELSDNRHWVMWEDPSLKPCYLFALVAGNLDCLEDTFITMSKREVKLQIYVEKGKVDQTQHAMNSLKRAMRWDEETFGREYDLDIYMIVAVSDFNFGAMENKGLNIFNDRFILAKPETATDNDYIDVESVIGHEYFHNWSGNRITVRDWFQITLKEGLTVFRDETFTEDVILGAVKRIADAKIIRTAQFSQDAGPMSHPIRPDHYIEINNFYTVTVYQKGAEVIRMMSTILGKDKFRKAMDLYFSRNDGNAVTTEDFVKAMEDASGIDLSQFRLWYSQSGTPILNVTDSYDANTRIYTLEVKQLCLPTADQKEKQNLHISLAIGLLDENGIDIPLQLIEEEKSYGNTRVLNIKKPSEVFKFVNVAKKPVPSLLRNFSAPVRLQYEYTEDDLLFLMAHDSDDFNRWNASQQFANKLLLQLITDYQAKRVLTLDKRFINAYSEVLENLTLNKNLVAEMLTLPSESSLIELMSIVDVDAIHNVRNFVRREITNQLKDLILKHYYENYLEDSPMFSADKVGRRRIKNLCLSYLAHLNNEDEITRAMKQFDQANNMTDIMGAIAPLMDIDCPQRKQALQKFYEKWQYEGLVVDKWFSLQALSSLSGTLHTVKELLKHPAYNPKRPNNVRALVGAFASGNHINFHNRSGEGYEFLAEQILEADKFNSQLAARLLEPLIRWRKFDTERQQLMKAQLERISKEKGLSKDVYEVVTKSLI